MDDEPDFMHGLRLRMRGHTSEWRISFADSGHDALALLRDDPADVVVCDFQMPFMDGATLLRHIEEADALVGRILLSGYDIDPHSALGQLAHAVIRKPCESGVLVAAIRDVLERSPVARCA